MAEKMNDICNMRIKLIRPSAEYAEQIMEYKQEMAENGDSFDGCAGLEDCSSYNEWADFENRLKAKYPDTYVPSEVFLAVRKTDNILIGMVDYRHPLTAFLLKYGGNIGYSIRPNERNKGYGTEVLNQIVSICHQYGEEKVLLTCDMINSASQKIIVKNGGVLENTVDDTVGLSKSGIILRYWIMVHQ